MSKSREWVRLIQGVCKKCGQLHWTENVNSHRYLALGWQLTNHCAFCNIKLIEPISWSEDSTEKQINYLKKLGYKRVSNDYTKGTASELIRLRVVADD